MRESLSGTISLWRRLWALRRTRSARWGLIFLVGLALLADFLANDKPLYCKLDGKHYFPAERHMLSKFRLTSWSLVHESTDWKALDYDAVIFPPVPYAPHETDLRNANFRSPFGEQRVKSTRHRHWLGTDHLGRDVLSGLIHGTRIALMVGLCSMLIAALIGIPLGATAGYLGDDRLKIPISTLVLVLLMTVICFYAVHLLFASSGSALFGVIVMAAVLVCFVFAIHVILRKLRKQGRSIILPVDMITIRGIEIIRSIPAFFLLFAILGMVRTPKLIYVMLLIAALWSPSIIRFVRAEALKLRNQTFIQSARILGLSHAQIVWRHVIPNAAGPALITLAFGIGSAVLIESGLSFLGIGIAPETVSWGKMLNTARDNFSAWWMALLPGLAIYFTIALFNNLGDALEQLIAGRGNTPD